MRTCFCKIATTVFLLATLAGVAQSARLLNTITNPTPAFHDIFGTSAAAVGSDRVLIGAPFDDTGATNAGAAYLFSTNGALLTTFTNPNPAFSEFFGNAVAPDQRHQHFHFAARANRQQILPLAQTVVRALAEHQHARVFLRMMS